MKIEHDPVEVAEDEPIEVAPAPPHNHEKPPIHEVIVAALATRLPCPTCQSMTPCRCLPMPETARTAERATLIEKALALYGYLPDPDAEPEEFDPETVAQWLADRSGFARYTQVEDGWHRLIEAEADVELAFIKAMKRVDADEVGDVKRAKAALLGWHQRKRV